LKLEKKSHFGNIKIVFKVQTQWDPDKSHVKKKKIKAFYSSSRTNMHKHNNNKKKKNFDLFNEI